MLASENIIPIDDVLSLRLIMPMDAEDIFKTIDNEREYLGKWLPFVKSTITVEDTLDFINLIVNAPEEKDVNVYTIRLDDQFIGIIGFKGTDVNNKKTELGYWLSEAYQGQGIMTRSVEVLCRKSFKEMDINRIQIRCAVGNEKSSHIPKRLGFTFEGIERDGEMLSKHQFVDLEIYSKLKRECEG